MNSNRWLIVLLASLMVFGLVACSGTDRTVENPTAQAPVEPQPTQAIEPGTTAAPSESVGQLQTVDLVDSMIMIKDADGAEHTFSFSDSTEILGTDTAQGLSTRQGNQVLVRWVDQDGRKMATRIEILAK